jgi:hypothetical protein
VYDRVRGAALLAGGAAGFRAGEVFVGVRSLGATDLVKLVLPKQVESGRIVP